MFCFFFFFHSENSQSGWLTRPSVVMCFQIGRQELLTIYCWKNPWEKEEGRSVETWDEKKSKVLSKAKICWSTGFPSFSLFSSVSPSLFFFLRSPSLSLSISLSPPSPLSLSLSTLSLSHSPFSSVSLSLSPLRLTLSSSLSFSLSLSLSLFLSISLSPFSFSV